MNLTLTELLYMMDVMEHYNASKKLTDVQLLALPKAAKLARMEHLNTASGLIGKMKTELQKCLAEMKDELLQRETSVDA